MATVRREVEAFAEAFAAEWERRLTADQRDHLRAPSEDQMALDDASPDDHGGPTR